MVTIARSTVIENISWETCHIKRPCATIISENSDICASEIEVSKDVLILYPKNEQMNSITRGLKITASRRNIRKCGHMPPIELRVSSIPSETKKTTEKKSLRDFTFPTISML